MAPFAPPPGTPRKPPRLGPATPSDLEAGGAPGSLRSRTFDIVFGHDSRAGRGFDVVLFVLILLSVLAVMLDSVSSIRAEHADALRAAEWIFTGLFTIEYLLRIWCVRQPRAYALSFFGVIDLLAVIPTYLSLILPGGQFLVVIRILRVMRVFRVLKLTRYVGEAGILAQALRASRYKISVFLLGVLSAVVVIGSLMYLVEGAELGLHQHPDGGLLEHRDAHHGRVRRHRAADPPGAGARGHGDDPRIRDHRGPHGDRERRARSAPSRGVSGRHDLHPVPDAGNRPGGPLLQALRDGAAGGLNHPGRPRPIPVPRSGHPRPTGPQIFVAIVPAAAICFPTMSARAIGTSTISFGLVSLPVKIYSTSGVVARKVSFNMIWKERGVRVRQQYIDPADGTVVPKDEIVKGYEFAKDQYVLFTDEELEVVEAPKSDEIEIVSFVPADSVGRLYFNKAYYLGPDKGWRPGVPPARRRASRRPAGWPSPSTPRAASSTSS